MTRHSRAFTLIETLMACTILSLLAAIIFAAFGPAREKSRQTVCVSNLHQFGQAFALYRQDYDGAEPAEGQPMTCEQLGLPALSMAGAFIQTYIKDKKITRCPDYHGQTPVEHMAVTYRWVPDFDQNAIHGHMFSQLVARRGAGVPLLYDDQHNPPFDLSKEPRWTQKRVLLLRLSQQVEVKQGSIREPSQDW